MLALGFFDAHGERNVARTTGPTNIDRRNSEVTKALPAYAGLSSEHRPPSKFGIFSSERHDAFPLDFAASLASRSAFKRS